MKTQIHFLVLFWFVLSFQLKSKAQEPLLKGSNAWIETVLQNVGQPVNGFSIPGNIAGISVYKTEQGNNRLLITHDFAADGGVSYQVENGLFLTGSRFSYLDLDPVTNKPKDAGLPFSIIYDRQGNEVTNASQINENGNGSSGFDHLSISTLFLSGQYGFYDDIMLFGEGSEEGLAYVMDLQEGEIWAVPALGRGAFYQFAAVEVEEGKIGLLFGDGTPGGHLYLYIGIKDKLGNGSFLDQNGLAAGDVYVWSGDVVTNPGQFHGTGFPADGSFFKLNLYDSSKSGVTGYDDLGYASWSTQQSLARLVNAFAFNGLRGISVNPLLGHQATFTASGGNNISSDAWGTTYQIDLSLGLTSATIHILYDGDDGGAGQVPAPFFGIRSPSGVMWSSNGRIYITEDEANSNVDFGGFLDLGSSVWELNPGSGKITRIGQVNRKGLPSDLIDTASSEPGAWSPVGLVDVSGFLGASQNNTSVFLVGVNAKSVLGDLGSYGQLLLLEGTNTFISTEVAMLTGLNGNHTTPVLTVGESPHGYNLPGVPDGIGIFELPTGQIRILVNNKIDEDAGGPYYLNNTLLLNGSRIWALDLNLVTREIEGSSIAYQKIIDRSGSEVQTASQVNHSGSIVSGLSNLSGGLLVPALHYNLQNDIFFVGEATSDGTFYALDAYQESLYAINAWGHATWKSIALFAGQSGSVSALLTLDRPDSPLLLWVGSPGEGMGNGFLNNNGLESGNLFAWVPDAPIMQGSFQGAHAEQDGHFIQLPVFQPDKAGTVGFDAMGFATETTLLSFVDNVGAYLFSYPGGLSVNPNQPNQVAMTSNGDGNSTPSNAWGSVLALTINPDDNSANITIIYDGDDFSGNNLPNPDFGIRNPGAVEWTNTNRLYIQETGALHNPLFGKSSGQETSTWEYNLETGASYRIARINRSARPFGLPDLKPSVTGAWGLGGIRDVSTNFTLPEESTLFLTTVQAHTIQDSLADNYVEGGQLLFLAGQTIFDPSTALQSSVKKMPIRIYPNPILQNKLNIELDAPSTQSVWLSITNLSGQVVFMKNFTLEAGKAEYRFHLPIQLAPGIHILQIRGDQWLSEPHKILICGQE